MNLAFLMRSLCIPGQWLLPVAECGVDGVDPARHASIAGDKAQRQQHRREDVGEAHHPAATERQRTVSERS